MKPYALDASAVVLLMVGAFMLNQMASPGRHPYSLYEVGRLMVFAGWALAAFRFYVHKLVPVSVAAAIIAIFF